MNTPVAASAIDSAAWPRIPPGPRSLSGGAGFPFQGVDGSLADELLNRTHACCGQTSGATEAMKIGAK
jgi:hypothetical protein